MDISCVECFFIDLVAERRLGIGRVVLSAIVVIVIVVAGASAFFVAHVTPGSSSSVSGNGPSSSEYSTAYSSTETSSQTSSFSTTLSTSSSSTGCNGAGCLMGMPSNLTACDGSVLYSYSPLALENLTAIEPLGHVEGGGHTFPINHVYLDLKLYQNRTAITSAVLSPGNITVWKIYRNVFYSNQSMSVVLMTDYSISYSPCQNVAGFFYHLSNLSDLLLSNFTAPYSCGIATPGGTSTAGQEIYQSCDKYVNIKVNAGERIGTAGGEPPPAGAQGLDWLMEDFRMAPLPFANDSRFDGVGQDYSRYVACPLDYFPTDLHNSLYGLLGGYPINANLGNLTVMKRTTPPFCGTTAQDVPGTAQGNWFVAGAPMGDDFTEYPNLALVHDNINTTLGVFSVGTSMRPSGLGPDAYYFNPSATGLVNTDFEHVTSDGNVYCYQAVEKVFSFTQAPLTPVIILQLISPTHLRIEMIGTNSCGAGPWQFTSNYTDFYR